MKSYRLHITDAPKKIGANRLREISRAFITNGLTACTVSRPRPRSGSGTQSYSRAIAQELPISTGLGTRSVAKRRGRVTRCGYAAQLGAPTSVRCCGRNPSASPIWRNSLAVRFTGLPLYRHPPSVKGRETTVFAPYDLGGNPPVVGLKGEANTSKVENNQLSQWTKNLSKRRSKRRSSITVASPMMNSLLSSSTQPRSNRLLNGCTGSYTGRNNPPLFYSAITGGSYAS